MHVTPSSRTSHRRFLLPLALVIFSILVTAPLLAAELAVNQSADYKGQYGLQVNLSDADPAFVQDDSPAAEPRYRARFAFDPKTLATTDGDRVDLFVGLDGGSNEVFRVVLINTGGLLQVALEDVASGESTAPGDRVTLNPFWTTLEIDWMAADSGSNGFLDLWVDGYPQPAASLSALANDASVVDSVQLGTANTTVGAPSGLFYVDEFSSNRASYIGLVQPFDDVGLSSVLFDWVAGIYNAGITGGCGAGNYCPDDPNNRAQMAVFLLKAAEGRDYVPPACTTQVFDDVPCSNGLSRWINELAARGITGGCGNNNFCPDDPVNRAQMAVFLLKAREGSAYLPPNCSVQQFNDVPCSDPLSRWINELANRSITGGCGSGDYCPTQTVSRGQMSIFLTKTFELPKPQS